MMAEPTQKLLGSLTFLDRAFQTSLERLAVAASAQVEAIDESSLSLEGEDDTFFRVPLRAQAGLLEKNSKAFDNDTFYKREEVSLLWNAINSLKGKNVLYVQGQPGTGKSTAVWRKILEAAIAGDNILWVSLDRDGLPVSTVYFQGKFYVQFNLELSTELKVFLYNPKEIPLDTVVIDGCSSTTKKFTTEVRRWVTHLGSGRNCRAIFTASTKVEKLRSHQHDDVSYHVVHSWIPEEFRRSLIHDDDTTTPIFEACAPLFYDEYGISETLLADNDDDKDNEDASSGVDENGDTGMDCLAPDDTSAKEKMVLDEEPNSSATKKMKHLSKTEILEVLSSRYNYSGGSARWMFNYPKSEIENELRTFCKSAANRQGILNGDIGPTSLAATNYFFGSSRMESGEAEYFLVSKRAVEILAEEAGGASSYEPLYRFADSLENPSFEGWIVEADLFSQLESARKQSSDFHPHNITQHCAPFKPEAIRSWEHSKNKNRVQVLRSKNAKEKTKKTELQRIKMIASNLLPQDSGKSMACKPTAWNQGGYDVFFVEFAGSDVSKICLRFGQVTKAMSHSLKGGYMFSVIDFFEAAGYKVESVEIAFLLTPKNVNIFTLAEVEGIDFLKEYGLFGAAPAKWQNSSDIAKYELQLSRHDV